MPNKSEAQRRAMAAAASGKSTLGIPKTVGSEFMASDKGGKLPKKAKCAPCKPKKPGRKTISRAIDRASRKANMETG